MADFDYDLFVIGAGSGGVRAARMSAQYGARTAIAEEYRVGGTCVIRGCVPKKLFVYASHFSEAFEDAAGYGWTVREAVFDWSALIAGKDREIDRLNRIYIRNLETAGVGIFNSRAVVRDAHTVHLVAENRDVRAGKILVATGAWPHMPAIPGIEYAISSNEAFYLQTLPRRITVVGGGYIAVEFAGIFNGLGCETIQLYRGPMILRGFDRDIRTALYEEMTGKGITIRNNTNIAAIEKQKSGALRVIPEEGEPFETDAVMYATGRYPNTGGLGLEQAGVTLGRNGAVEVDAYSKTSVDSIYAVGDVTNRANLTPVAIREGAAFAETVFNNNPVAVDHSTIPTAVFSQPEIGTAGLGEEDARKTFTDDDIVIYRSLFRPMLHTLSGRDEKMMMKIVVQKSTDRVVGVHLMGPSSGELIQVIGIALVAGVTKAQFDATIAVHPTAAEELVTMNEPLVSP